MPAPRRDALRMLACLLFGLVAGFLLARLLEDGGPVVIDGPSTQGRTPEGGDPARETTTPPRPGDATPVPVPPPERTAASPPSTVSPAAPGERGVAAWFVVSVRRPDGTGPRNGIVYAVPAGERGPEEVQDVPHADLGDDRTARIPVPAAGLYDIGFRGQWEWGVLTDAAIAAGETRTVDVLLPEAKSIAFNCSPSWPPPGLPRAVGTVSLHADDRGAVDYPGRDGTGSFSVHWDLGTDGSLHTPPLPAGRTWEVRSEIRPNPEGRHEPGQPWFYFEPEPKLARAGDTVRLNVVEHGWLRVRLRAGPGPRPEQPPYAMVRFTQGDRSGTSLMRVCLVADQHGVGNFESSFRGLPGPATISWEGNGVPPGSADVVIVASALTDFEPEVRLDPLHRASDPSLPEGGPAPTPARGGGPLRIRPAPPPTGGPLPPGFGVVAGTAGRLEGDSPADGAMDTGDSAEGINFSPDWRGVPSVLAFSGHGLASDPVPVPREGDLEVTLRPAGLAMVVLERVPEPSLGRLSLRRPDGLPILYQEYEDGDTPFTSSAPGPYPVRPGALLGPFPAGTMKFEVRLGGYRLADVSVRIEAGRIRPLLIDVK